MPFIPLALLWLCANPAPPLSGYEPEQGFFLASPDRNYKLRIGFVGGYKVEPDYNGGSFQDRNEFSVLRPFMEGYVFRPWITFNMTLELVGNPPYLLDSYVDLRPIRAFGLRAGLQSTPFSRHKAFEPYEILFPDWAVTAEYFWSGHAHQRREGSRLPRPLQWHAAASVHGGGWQLRRPRARHREPVRQDRDH